MEHLSPLPARETLLPGESLASLVRRYAVAMGYENTRWILQGLPSSHEFSRLNALAADGPLEILTVLLRQSHECLREGTVHRFARELMLTPRDVPAVERCDSKTALRFFAEISPICPLCLPKDPAYERLLWSFRPLPVCREHGCFLIASCPACGRALRPRRLDLRRCRCGGDLSSGAVTPAPALVQPLAEVFHRALIQREPPLPGLSVAAGFWWAERLASAVSRTPAWQAVLRERWTIPDRVSAMALSWLAAADLILDWPQRIEGFLDVCQTATRHRQSASGISRGFGLLLREARDLERLGFSAPADGLREYLVARYSRGHLNAKVCLFQEPEHRRALTQRPWISQTAVARRLKLRHGAVADLMRRGVLDGRMTAVGSRGRSMGLVCRTSVETLRRELRTALSVPEVALRLGFGRSRVFELIRGDLLPRSVRTIGGWRIPVASVDALLAQLEALPVENDSIETGIDLREATRRFGRRGLTLVRLLTAVLGGHVPAFRLANFPDFRGVRVEVDGLRSLLPQMQQEAQAETGYTLIALAAQLYPGRPLKESVLRKWISTGLLSAHKSRRVWCILPDEVDRFRSTYCLADEACRLLGIHRHTLTRWEAEGRIAAVYGRRTTARAGASVFRRADLIALRDNDSTT